MKRRVLRATKLMALALSMGLIGCGGGGIEEGAPSADQPAGVKIDPKMTDMTGRSFKETSSAKAKSAAAKAAPAEVPAEEKK